VLPVTHKSLSRISALETLTQNLRFAILVSIDCTSNRLRDRECLCHIKRFCVGAARVAPLYVAVGTPKIRTRTKAPRAFFNLNPA